MSCSCNQTPCKSGEEAHENVPADKQDDNRITVFQLFTSHRIRSGFELLSGRKVVGDGFNILLFCIPMLLTLKYKLDSVDDIVEAFTVVIDRLMEHCSYLLVVFDNS